MNEPAASPSQQGADLRVSDHERERVVDLLSRHAAEGRLDVDELDARIDRAFAARTRGELEAITSDLPTPGDGTPRRRRNRRSGLPLLSHGLVPFVAVNVLLVAIWAATGAGYFWPIWPILGWGFALVKGGGSCGHRRSRVARAPHGLRPASRP